VGQGILSLCDCVPFGHLVISAKRGRPNLDLLHDAASICGLSLGLLSTAAPAKFILWASGAGRCTMTARERDIDAALETASNCREAASIYRQLGFTVLEKWLIENAKAAEMWATKR
jgi:hypothetical protein